MISVTLVKTLQSAQNLIPEREREFTKIVTLYKRYTCPDGLVDYFDWEIKHDKWLVFPWEP